MTGSPEAQYRQFLAQYPLQQANGWRWVDTSSAGAPLILLPGFMGESETSFLYVLALAPRLRVISVSYPPAIGQVQALGASFANFLDDLGIHQATIVGGSSSGFLAQAFLRQIPTRISACILSHTGLPSPARARTARFGLQLLHFLPFGLLNRLMQVSVNGYFPGRMPAHAFWRGHFREAIRRETKESLISRFALMEDIHSNYHFQPDDVSAWPGRLLILEMRRDHLTSPAEQAAMRSLYPNAIIHTFDETAHYDSVERPAEQIEVIRDFLR
ncbi:MAG: alpha/beta hydrolase [Anaerolineales bacterium]|jgi:pimeloyl-ACP methyl ester carboxylesterase|nr:alpha/beta hydrolase [Anaerolineales bacterium]